MQSELARAGSNVTAVHYTMLPMPVLALNQSDAFFPQTSATSVRPNPSNQTSFARAGIASSLFCSREQT